MSSLSNLKEKVLISELSARNFLANIIYNNNDKNGFEFHNSDDVCAQFYHFFFLFMLYYFDNLEINVTLIAFANLEYKKSLQGIKISSNNSNFLCKF